MAAQTSWVGEAPAVNHSVSIDIKNAALAKIGLDSDELYGSGLPRIVGNSAAIRRVLGMVLDLKDLILVGREAISFLERCETDGITLRNCARYVRELITRQRRGS